MSANDMKELEDLANEAADIIVIGGGITGVGIALDATLRGLRVALFEKQDFSSGTSSRSSKLIHGGFRYLEHRKFRLVKESLRERAVLRSIAPHQVKPLPFLIPIYKNEKPPALLLRLGLWIYDLLAIGKNIGWHKWFGRKAVLRKIPILSPDRLKGAGYYFDCQMVDARLNIEVALKAKELGAKIFNYTEVIGFSHDQSGIVTGVEVHHLESGKRHSIMGSVVINACGAWADDISRLENINAEKRLGVSKGVHLIVPRIVMDDLAIAIPTKDRRIVYVLPWGKEYSMLGTTDTFYEGNLEDIVCTKEDVEYLLKAITRILPNTNLTLESVISSFAGVRPLVFTQKEGLASPSDVSREDRIVVDKSEMITIVGGKFTTYRKMAERITDLAVRILKQRRVLPFRTLRCVTSKTPLYGGNIANWDLFREKESERIRIELGISPESAEMLVKTYGSQLQSLIDLCKSDPSLKARLSPNGAYIQAQVIYSVGREMCRHVADFLSRRTFLCFERGLGLDCVETVASLMGKELHWTNEIATKEVQQYRSYIASNSRFRL